MMQQNVILAMTDFMDVTFDLKCDTYYPYRKQQKDIVYT